MMKHAKIAIIGSGAVGATTAYAIMWKNIAAEILLVDIDQKRCKGEVLDLSDTIPFSCTSCLRQGTFTDAGQADIIIITAGARQKPAQTRSELLNINANIVTSIIKSLQPINHQAILIIVTNPVDCMTCLAHQSAHLPKTQIIGSGTYLDTQRLIGLLSRQLLVSQQSIDAFILGEHGDSQFAAWSCAYIAGIPLKKYPGITDDILKKIEETTKNRVYEIIECKQATYFGVAACIADMCKSIIFNQRRIMPVSCYVPEYDVCLNVPVILGEKGIQAQIPLYLDNREMSLLKQSAESIKQLMREKITTR